MQELVRLVSGRNNMRLLGREGEIFSVTKRARYHTQILFGGNEEWFYSHRFEDVEPVKNIGTQPLYTGDPANPTEVKPSSMASVMLEAGRAAGFPTLEPPAAPAQAMRLNSGKPQLSYLLSFSDATSHAFRESPFVRGLYELAEWYQGNIMDPAELNEALCEAIHTLLSCLDHAWPEMLCQVSMFGANKYARGNYLKGRSWSDTCDSLLRHIRLRDSGETCDQDSGLPHDGHIAWNLLFLQHCVLTMPHFDDRLRAPE